MSAITTTVEETVTTEDSTTEDTVADNVAKFFDADNVSMMGGWTN